VLKQPISVHIRGSGNDAVFVAIIPGVDSFHCARSRRSRTLSWYWTLYRSSGQPLNSLKKTDVLDALDEANGIPTLVAAIADPAA
jgi:hypothetical protein